MSSSIQHDISGFSKWAHENPLLTYINFIFHNPLEFFIQRINAFYELWGPYPFEINTKVFKLMIGFRFILFLSFVIGFIHSFKNKIFSFSNEVGRFMIIYSLFILNITLIHTIYFSSFRFIVPIEPLMFIIFLFAVLFLFSRRVNIN